MITEKDLLKYTYTTGAFIVPKWDKEIERWIWVVAEFDDDTFCGGEAFSPDVSSPTLIGLNKDEKEMETWKCPKCGTDCSATTCYGDKE